MKIRLKLYAMLASWLPSGAERNQADIEIADGASVQDVLKSRNLPDESCHLVLVNGIYTPPRERSGRTLSEGDHVAVWPPVAGG